MSKININRRDDIDSYYKTAALISRVKLFLLIATVVTTFLIFYSFLIGFINEGILKTTYITSAWLYFVASQALKFWFVPKAESARRTQMISNALGVPLCHEKTFLYYNNNFPASISRLGANIMENALFTRSIVARMLLNNSIFTFAFIVLWVTVLVIRHESLDLIILVTQTIFSYELIVQWLKLMFLKIRSEHVYKDLYSHYLHHNEKDTAPANASVLDYFAEYETAKSTAGVLLSSKIFHKLNQSLSEQWDQIQIELNMGQMDKDDTE